jgi:hypothetical protein
MLRATLKSRLYPDTCVGSVSSHAIWVASVHAATVQGVSDAWLQRLTRAFDKAMDDPDAALGPLVGMVHARPDLLPLEKWAALEQRLTDRYGLTDTRLLLPAH